MLVFYIDPYPLGDPLFLTGLARDLKARLDVGGSGLILVLGSGEEGDRAIEALGAEPRREAGALAFANDEEASAVERAARDLHRRVVDALNEAGISAVRIAASDRGLFREGGSVGKARWVRDLALQRAVPVVLAVAEDEQGVVRDLDPATLAGRLATALEAPAVALGSPPEGSRSASLEELSGSVPDANALRRMASESLTSIVVRRSALRQPGVPIGVMVET
ncbi:MAG: hypothetical protein AAGI52_14555 [Bacteroidota bacterium]